MVKNRLISGIYFAVTAVAGIFHDVNAYEIYDNPEIANFVGGYQWDVALPMSLYFFHKAANLSFSKNNLFNAAFVFLGCSAFEMAQAVGLYSGTFDPYDFLAYGAGTALALGADRLTFGRNNTIDILPRLKSLPAVGSSASLQSGDSLTGATEALA